MSVPSVHRLSVSSTGPGRRKLLEVSIDAPRDGGTSDAWAVRVSGHLLSEAGPVPRDRRRRPRIGAGDGDHRTPDAGGRRASPGRAGSRGVRLHAAGGHARSAATLRVSRARGAAGRVAGEGRGHRRGATCADDSVRAALAAIAGHLAGEDGHHPPDADALRAPRGGRLRPSTVRGARREVLAARAENAGRSRRCQQAGRRADGVPSRDAGRGRQPLLLRRVCGVAGGGGLVGLDVHRGSRRILPAQHRRLVPGNRRRTG